MSSSPTNEMQEAMRPIGSLISKSEKALQKLAPGTWQLAMLQENLRALHIALALMNRSPNDATAHRRDVLLSALKTFAAMKRSSENAQVKFAPGTPQYALLQNRLRAILTAEDLINAELK